MNAPWLCTASSTWSPRSLSATVMGVPSRPNLTAFERRLETSCSTPLAVPLALYVAFYFEPEAPGGVQLLHRVDVLLAELEQVGGCALDGDAGPPCTRVVEELV